MNEVKLYIDQLKTRGLAKESIRQYSLVLSSFHNFLSERKVTFAEATFQDICGYQKLLIKRTSARTTNKEMGIINIFYCWMLSKGYVLRCPSSKLLRLREKKIQRVTLLHEELFLFYKLVKNDKSVKIEDLTMLNVLIGTGLKGGELCNLKVSDFIEQGEVGFFRLRGSDRINDRIVSMPEYTKESVRHFIKAMQLGCKNENWIFTNSRGRQLNNPVVYNRISKMTYGAMGLKIGPRMLRVTFATHAMNEQRVPLKALQIQMGYKELASTTFCAERVTLDVIKKNFDKCHPRA